MKKTISIFILFFSFFFFGFSLPWSLSNLSARIFSHKEFSLHGMPMENLLMQERTLRHTGDEFFAENNYEKALEYYEKALEIIPYKFETLYNKACVFALLGKKQKALQTLKLSALIHNYAVDLAKDDSDLDSLRDMKAFQDFILWEEE